MLSSRKALQALLVTGSVVALGTAVTPVWAQNSPKSGNLTFSTAVDIDTNPNLSTTSAGTVFSASENLSFGFKTESSFQFLEFFGSGGVNFSKTVGSTSSTSVNKPQGTLHYFRDGANANLDLAASFWSGDVVSAFDADPSSAVSIIVDTGTLSKTTATATANWGLGAPLGFSLDASHKRDDYAGTTDPNLFDSRTTSLGLTARARISPTTQADFSITGSLYDASDALATSKETVDYQVQLTHQVNPALSINGTLGFQEQATTAGGVTTASSGPFGGLGFVQALSTGSIFGDVSYDGTGSTTSAAATLGRQVDFPQGSLTASLTADWGSARGTQLLGSAAFSRQFPDGSFDVSLSQSLSTDSLNQDIKYTHLGVGFQKTLNSVSGIDLSLDLSRSEDGGVGSAATVDRATLTTSYSRALTSDWNMSAGYRHRRFTGAENSDSVFFTLTKDLRFGF